MTTNPLRTGTTNLKSFFEKLKCSLEEKNPKDSILGTKERPVDDQTQPSNLKGDQTLYLPHIIYLVYSEGEECMKLVTVLLPEAYLEGLDELVRRNMYPSRSAAIRSSVRDLLKKELWERRGR